MRLNHMLYFSAFGISTVLLKRKRPILGTIILTDDCNLSCKHCSVNNIRKTHYPYGNIRQEMQSLYTEGVRILFFCGGESFLWRDGDKDLHFLVRKAKEIGFYIVNVVTNGTLGLNIEGADVIFLSLDGLKKAHNLIRGDTFDKIMANVERTNDQNICIYMAINRLNYQDIRDLAELVRNHPQLKSISFNFHTPYAGTQELSLSEGEKRACIEEIKALIKEGYPIFNLSGSLDFFLKNNWARPCYQCIVMEQGKRYICGRCSEIVGLCTKCGYLFAVEFSLLFSGNWKIIWEVFRTYLKFV
jgi:MoaA/NifB/PqqE/SkfB family radical SAM enzyme